MTLEETCQAILMVYRLRGNDNGAAAWMSILRDVQAGLISEGSFIDYATMRLNELTTP